VNGEKWKTNNTTLQWVILLFYTVQFTSLYIYVRQTITSIGIYCLTCHCSRCIHGIQQQLVRQAASTRRVLHIAEFIHKNVKIEKSCVWNDPLSLRRVSLYILLNLTKRSLVHQSNRLLRQPPSRVLKTKHLQSWDSAESCPRTYTKHCW